ncbi:MAG: carboxypeptidase-like regulatory domain-containing protein [Alistipes sp.]|nr:carboxypeptidase-like regulatory domain-containing protein [Alistipes sp.]
MKKLFFIFLMSIATNFAFAQSGEGQTLYIIDGVVSTKAAVDELPSDMIRNMNVVKGVESVVIITTQNGREISGRVVDTEGKPMAGVLVMVPKTKAGVATDANGYYKINLAAGEAFLQYMYVDYPTITVSVDKANMDDVVMDKNQAENTVVIRDASLKVENFTYQPSKSTVDALCIIKKPNGEIYKGDINSISPNEMKTMHVFKGEQGEQFKKYGDTSNGVILIELK